MATAANTVYKLQRTQYLLANNTMIQNADMIIRGNLTVVGGTTYANTQTLLVRDNIITLNAAINQSGVPTMDAGIEVDRGSELNVALMWKETEGAWKFTNDGVNYETLGGGSAGSYANSAFLQANAAFASANNVAPQVQPAFDKANAAYALANSSVAWSTRQSFIATAGQTIFSPGSGYLVGYIDVYYNGLKLYGGEDYTATDGVNVILTNPTNANDVVEVVGFGANVPVNNVYVLNSMTSLLNRQTFFATEGQTTFVPSQKYRVGYVDVYYNGLKLNIPEDVTASDGTNIVFVGLTPTINDVIEVVGLTPNVALANAIPITGGSVSGGLTLAGNVLPSSTNTYYLGSATNRWHSLFVGPGSIDIGGLILSNTNGTLGVSSPGQPVTPLAGEDNWVRNHANAAFAAANSVNVYGANTALTNYFAIPQGTTAQRPTNAANGHIRYNTSSGVLETYLHSAGWVGIVADRYSIEVLLVAGGAGGGGGFNHSACGGGGGAGGVTTSNITNVQAGTSYTVTVGAGGSGGIGVGGNYGQNGSNSSVTLLTSTLFNAVGGGGGGTFPALQGRTGGSGGGGGGAGEATAAGGSGTPGQGYPGGAHVGTGQSNSSTSSGGGGGAGGPGGGGTVNSTGGAGGPGIVNPFSGSLIGELSNSVYYIAGGGGGASSQGSNSSGGLGGGGYGYAGTGAGGSGSTNTGAGGGGSGSAGAPSSSTSGAPGGSGVVIIRYSGSQRGTGGSVTYTGTHTLHTFTGSGTFIA